MQPQQLHTSLQASSSAMFNHKSHMYSEGVSYQFPHMSSHHFTQQCSTCCSILVTRIMNHKWGFLPKIAFNIVYVQKLL